MNSKLIISTTFALFFGFLLIGQSITGRVISQSCCFPPNCSPENICDSAKPNIESPQNTIAGNNIIGITIIVLTLIIFIASNRKMK